MPSTPPSGNEDDRRLSADGTLTDPQEFTSSASSPTSTRPEKAQRDTPYSPRPRLFDNLPLPSGPAASDVLSEADYRRLRTDSFRPSSLAGPLIASSVLAYFAPRILPSRSGNPNTLRSGIFLFSLASLMGISTYLSISKEVSGARTRAIHQALPRTEDGQVILLDQTPAGRSSAEEGEGTRHVPTMANSDPVLAAIGKPKARTRWVKGQGLDGEVEEEGELRDTFFRPGVPRK